MGMFTSQIGAMVLASALAGAVVAPAAGQPAFAPHAPKAGPAVILAQNSVVIRRELHNGGWKKRWHQRRDNKNSARNHYDRSWQFRPQATPKYAYDAYGNYRIYDGDGWRDNDWRHHDWNGEDWNGSGWDSNDGWDGNGRKHRPRIYKRSNSTVPQPPEALEDVLTAVPK